MGDIVNVDKATGGLFKKPKPDKSLELLRRRQEEEKKSQDSEIAERKAAKRRFATGRGSLLSGSAVGVPGSKSTLG